MQQPPSNQPVADDFEQQFTKALDVFIEKTPTVDIHLLSTSVVVALIGHVQLAMRHPANQHTAAAGLAYAWSTYLIESLFAEHPVLLEGFRRGFNPKLDPAFNSARTKAASLLSNN